MFLTFAANKQVRAIKESLKGVRMHERLDGIDVAALCLGGKTAWDDFVPPAAALIKAVARRVLGAHEHEISDVVQEVFVRLSGDGFKLLRNFDPQRAKLSTWLGVITSAVAVDCLRRKPRGEMPLDDVPEELLGTVDAPGLAQLKLPVGLLSPRQSLILALLYEKDMTPEEVAQTLRIDAQTVRSQRHKAISKLREAWGEGLQLPQSKRRMNGGNDHGN
jgi:RNA polymerase sigma factor (sigma-70 family)